MKLYRQLAVLFDGQGSKASICELASVTVYAVVPLGNASDVRAALMLSSSTVIGPRIVSCARQSSSLSLTCLTSSRRLIKRQQIKSLCLAWRPLLRLSVAITFARFFLYFAPSVALLTVARRTDSLLLSLLATTLASLVPIRVSWPESK